MAKATITIEDTKKDTIRWKTEFQPKLNLKLKKELIPLSQIIALNMMNHLAEIIKKYADEKNG